MKLEKGKWNRGTYCIKIFNKKYYFKVRSVSQWQIIEQEAFIFLKLQEYNFFSSPQLIGKIKFLNFAGLITKELKGSPGHKAITLFGLDKTIRGIHKAIENIAVITTDTAIFEDRTTTKYIDRQIDRLNNLSEYKLQELLHPSLPNQKLVLSKYLSCLYSRRESQNSIVTHGDLSLPNIIYSSKGTYIGILDVGDFAITPFERELIAPYWSIWGNLGKDAADIFLSDYNYKNINKEIFICYQIIYCLNLTHSFPWYWGQYK